MSQMINRTKELIRISPKDSRVLEYSTNDGKVWARRYKASSIQGDLEDLTDDGKGILITCEKGLLYSVNEGRVWTRRNGH